MPRQRRAPFSHAFAVFPALGHAGRCVASSRRCCRNRDVALAIKRQSWWPSCSFPLSAPLSSISFAGEIRFPRFTSTRSISQLTPPSPRTLSEPARIVSRHRSCSHAGVPLRLSVSATAGHLTVANLFWSSSRLPVCCYSSAVMPCS